MKSKRYWKLDETTQQVAEGYPRYFNVDWFGCQAMETSENDHDEGSSAGSTFRTHSSNSIFLVISAFVLCIKRIAL